MASLSYNVSSYIKRVRDSLKLGQGWTSASLALGSTTSAFKVTARNPGAAGNSITVAVTEPSGTHPLTITVTGTAITIELSVSSGTHVDADNTATKICNAINASTAAKALVEAALVGSGAGSISAAVTVAPLAGGADGSSAAALNFLRAQDMATVLDLLQNGLDQPATMTATATGTATTVVDGAGTFVPGQQVGNILTFKSNTTTTALQGKSYRILGNTDTTLTLETMAAASATGDTYTLTGGIFDSAIADLREGKGLGDAPAGNLLGDYRIVQDALSKVVQTLGTVQASAALTFSGQPTNTQTVTIDGKVYVMQDTLTNVNGNVKIGADAATTIANLVAAITLGAGSGTAYAAAMTKHATVTATGTATVLTVTARTLAGAGGNSIAVSETLSNAVWGTSTLSGGTTAQPRTQTVASLTCGTGSTTTQVVVNTTNSGRLRIDQFRGMVVTISSEDRFVVGNDETSLLLSKALTSAPSAATAISVTMPQKLSMGVMKPGRVHPGGQPTNNAILADLIDQAEAAVIAYVLPT